jgi:hypothetical protein
LVCIIHCIAVSAGTLAGQFIAPLECCMSALNQIRQWQSVAKTRRLVTAALIGLPLLVALFMLAFRFLPMTVAIITVATVIGILIWHTLKSIQALDNNWLVRQLDQALANLEDSSDLLFRPTSELSSLQNLQRERIEQRISNLANVDLRERWPIKIIVLFGFSALIIGSIAVFFPHSTPETTSVALIQANGKPKAAVPIVLVDQQLIIRAPSYTGLPTRSEKNLQIKFPEGSLLSWNLKFQPEPGSVDLVFHDGSRLALKKNAGDWQGSKVLLQSSLYRIQVNHAALNEDKLYRLDAIKDLPPQIRVLQPDRNLSLVEPGQSHWPLSFEAEDEYGLGEAQLQLQLAQGNGENIKFSEQSRKIAGQGSRTRKRFAQQLDLAALGLGPGDDLIIQFSVNDQRSPLINTTRSSSFILRWPSEDLVEASGVEGLVKKVMPAYFRSQRQIIIDTEKLLANRNKLSAEAFAIQSDTIGVDQRILRLRYGQFLGEEAEGEHEEHADEAPGKKATANDNQAILEEYGHVHDIPEAATLLDAKTKELLRAALNEMWQAELHLRSAQPKQALPYEYRALAFIKKVQQADRIYLARVGPELPPIDETRRLSGDRRSLKNRSDILRAADVEDAALIKFWQSLDQLEFAITDGNAVSSDFKAFRLWLREHPGRAPDALGLLVALDALEKQPNCKACLVEIKARLWPMLPMSPANPRQRIISNAETQKYLDALQLERQP